MAHANSECQVVKSRSSFLASDIPLVPQGHEGWQTHNMVCIGDFRVQTEEGGDQCQRGESVFEEVRGSAEEINKIPFA